MLVFGGVPGKITDPNEVPSFGDLTESFENHEAKNLKTNL